MANLLLVSYGTGSLEITESANLRLLLGLAYLAWITSELVGAILLPNLRWGTVVESRRSDRGSRVAILLGIAAGIGVSTLFSGLGYSTFPPVVELAGVLLMVGGIGVRQWAIATLGRFFSTSVRVVAGHRIVEVGPYRYLRHPSYTGALTTLVGAGLAGGSWEGILVIIAVAAAIFGYRIHVEEELLIAEFGEEYRAYQARTKRILPFLL